MRPASGAACLTLLLFGVVPLEAEQQPVADVPAASSWTFDVDGVLFGTFSHQGGRRGATEFRSQNWLMGMASRRLGSGSFSATGMISSEALTAPGRGYAQLFQGGEAYEGFQITDHQHPHDLVMQLAAAWTVPLDQWTSLTIAGGPVGEPALGPIPFMHRASSAENPIAPLSHHIFDSTHLSSGVILGRIDHRAVSVEGSVFRGRESDENRYDFDLGAPDSWSVRGWVRPTPAWLIQVSHGFLNEPEALEPGDQRRSSASVSWTLRGPSRLTALTAALGRNERQYSAVDSFLLEGTHKVGRTSVYGRLERTEIETEILLIPHNVHVPHPGELVDTVQAITLGGVRDLAAIRGLSLGVGGDVAFYGVPALLENTHGTWPLSFHVFFRLAKADLTRRMWDMTMAQHGATGAGHQHH